MWTYIPFIMALLGAYIGYESYETLLYNVISMGTGFIVGGLLGQWLRGFTQWKG